MYYRSVHIWLIAMNLMVAIIFLFGALTRLTESGLSMVEWQLFTLLPPLSEIEWLKIFDNYKTTYEYINKNNWMVLEDFKSIFWLEYIHRLSARLLGFAAFFPLIFFAYRSMIERYLLKYILGLIILGSLQGAIGWLMVHNGLFDKLSVSSYYLALHFSFAMLIFILLTRLSIIYGRNINVSIMVERKYCIAIICIYITMVYGAIVSGLDAVLACNTFPDMFGYFFHPDANALQPWWKNLFETPLMAQFIHRYLAIFTALYLLYLGHKDIRKIEFRKPAIFLLLAVGGQVTLGIKLILFSAPLILAIMHHVFAFIILSTCLYILAIKQEQLQNAR